jgi:CRISPR system Cascade subunit CasB
MKEFIEWLENLNLQDTRVRGVLRRSLAFEPGNFPAAYSYVEPFLKDEDNFWRRKVFYLVAGLWAAHWREDPRGEVMTFGRACAAYQLKSKSSSTERRFITLLDSDTDQLPHRLRQMLSLLKDQAIDFGDLLTRLLYWNDEGKITQTSWARHFYRKLNQEATGENHTHREKKNENHH